MYLTAHEHHRQIERHRNMVEFSRSVIVDGWGFREDVRASEIEAEFSALHVLTVRGLTMADGDLARADGAVDGRRFSLAIGNSVNALSSALAGEPFCDDEGAWMVEARVAPPFVVLLLGPTKRHQSVAKYLREVDGQIVTYRGFAAAGAELRAMEDVVMPRTRASLVTSLNRSGHPVSLHHVSRTVVGREASGRSLTDLDPTVSAQVTVATRRGKVELQQQIDDAIPLATVIDLRSARYLSLGLAETDGLKRFLFLFLSLETATNVTYDALGRPKDEKLLQSAPSRLEGSAKHLAQTDPEHWRSLRAKFIWCGLLKWVSIGDADVDQFVNLKKVRDAIAHGTIAEPDQALCRELESLSLRLHAVVWK